MIKLNNCYRTLLGVTTLLLLCITAVVARSATTDRAAVIAVTERWAAAYGNGDLKAIAEMYTEDAKLMPEGSEVISGRSAIRQWFETNVRPALPATIKFSNYEIYPASQWASSVSEVEIRDESGKLKTRGKQILVLLKRHGRWQIHRDIWTNNGPAKD
jgi:uncharacterized protein (TIGR02246 family)